jgi:hypothetical protein
MTTIFLVKETRQEIDWDDYNDTMITYNLGAFSTREFAEQYVGRCRECKSFKLFTLFEIEQLEIDEFHE